MTWNYRVCRRYFPQHGEHVYDIREVFYNDEGAPDGWTANACHPQGESLDGLRHDLDLMAKAFDLPVIELSTDAEQLKTES